MTFIEGVKGEKIPVEEKEERGVLERPRILGLRGVDK